MRILRKEVTYSTVEAIEIVNDEGQKDVEFKDVETTETLSFSLAVDSHKIFEKETGKRLLDVLFGMGGETKDIDVNNITEDDIKKIDLYSYIDLAAACFLSKKTKGKITHDSYVEFKQHQATMQLIFDEDFLGDLFNLIIDNSLDRKK